MRNLEKFLDLFTISEKEEKKEIKEDDVVLQYDITKISVKKLVKVLNYLDLEHYKSITPIHLLNTNDSSSIHALLTQHTNLINLVKNNKKNKKYFFRLAKALLLKNNLNSFMSVYNGLKSIFTSKKLKEYYDYDDTNFIRKECYSDKVIIPPIKFFLNELSSHVNQSKNFYKCVELFVKIQDTKPVKINKKRVKRVKEILSSQPKNISLKNDFFDFLIFLVE